MTRSVRTVDEDKVSATLTLAVPAANVFALLAGSGEEQASAKLCRVEFDEVAVAFDPPT